MVEPENKLFALKDGWTSQETRERQRLNALSELGLRQTETIPVFEEATQTAAHFLEAPISILGFIDQERHWFKSAVGLSRLGLMNQLAQSRYLLRQESFCTQVVDTCQVLVINDTKIVASAELSGCKLVNEYGIRAYLGVPLIDASGHCLGALAVMDLEPRNFKTRDIEFLQILARWSMSEFERNRLVQIVSNNSNSSWSHRDASINELRIRSEIPLERQIDSVEVDTEPTLENHYSNFTGSRSQKDPVPTNQLKLELLEQLTQELRTPLTSILGMASVLGREIYGPLTIKQREYLEIIQHSGRYLLSLANEIAELGVLHENIATLNLAPIDIEMLCQQAINTLEEAANRREQDIRLSIEPGRTRIWTLDKDKVRQMLYHLIFSVIQLSATGSIVRIHVSYKDDLLNITVWVSHPWLGDGITEVDPCFRLKTLPRHELGGDSSLYNIHSENQEHTGNLQVSLQTPKHLNMFDSELPIVGSSKNSGKPQGDLSRETLGLMLSCQLAELHKGKITIQGSPVSGYRYVVSLPLHLETPQEFSNV
ncbi:GAF domain-containing sensor histidine kinase [Aetokthonos hydrillicola Thurmond2011]|jgi:signal transduction histidine kinase|uniref:histidine kinase n=1 Tax=Aetokthonos hydrillicola Thurmond2011 TaxID=2712845 RepID=A0AAP5IBW4_9CYAN|nr:GAF domain-containing sensor histidine kinase [Aetokthonos hydrillicola]MBO3462367.1 GAF domain-containing sensor histidine kinase [Aetokthonos hydrillicola CCALA 1050]MBW4584216.1 GAF domain-containing sensor histidine kinase [Aetokthonos hydrillicola CCALA 1050]MDR9898576.1 GAF domain-containing sensor histidine kinase [Aetokthonos hydrillicola Thurmond2011]